MKRFAWLSGLLTRFENEHILVRGGFHFLLPPAYVIHVEVEDWLNCISEIAKQDFRWAAVWAEEFPAAPPHQPEGSFLIYSCYEKQGCHLILMTEIPYNQPSLPSQTHLYPAANRPERHLRDLLGLVFTNHPQLERWTRHKAWQKGQYPLRKNFPKQGLKVRSPSPPDSDYPFLAAVGTGVYEIPVGPVHAGIIEPGHFRFQAVGEKILNLEEHLGYVHKGIEKNAEGRDAHSLARLAGRISGDSTVAYTWATCMAMEKAIHLQIPPRGLFLRAVLAERERIVNHLWDVAAICNDVAFAFPYYQLGRLRELWLRLNQKTFRHRLLMDCIVPGGVVVDLDEAQLAEHIKQIQELPIELAEIESTLQRHAGLEDRLATTGILTPEQAKRLGCLGFVGRASGQEYDVRRNSPYPPYDQLEVEVPVDTKGDVEARMWIRLKEIHVSLKLLDHLLNNMPTGEVCTAWDFHVESAQGLGIVEGWRGEILCFLRFGENNTISRYYIRDPSWLNWPALEILIRDNIVPDFPVCNKSVNGSYSGCDL